MKPLMQVPEEARELDKELKQITKQKNEAVRSQDFEKVIDNGLISVREKKQWMNYFGIIFMLLEHIYYYDLKYLLSHKNFDPVQSSSRTFCICINVT
jgi:hypothetical protein